MEGINKEYSIIDQFKEKQIVVIGDVMIDRYLYGQVTRISPEAPVPIVQYKKEENRLGGAANVALNIRALGATPYLISVIGTDKNASVFQNLLPQCNLPDQGIFQSDFRQTTVKTRVLAGSQQMMRVDREDTHDLNQEEKNKVISSLQQLLDQYPIDAIVLQDYNKGMLTENLIQQVVSIAIERDIPVIVDPKKKNFFSYKKVSFFKPNLKEVQESVPFEVSAEFASLKRASAFLRKELTHQITMITLSEKGIFIDDGKNAAIIPTIPRNIADVCGAGDTVVSVCSLALALQCSIEEIGLLGNLAGGQVCERVGVVPINLQQLQVEYSNYIQSK